MPSQQKEPPPLPLSLDDEAFEDVPLLVKEIEAAIATASGNELKVLRLMAEHLKNIDGKVAHLNNGAHRALQGLSKDLKALPDEEAIGEAVANELIDVHRRFDKIAAMVTNLEKRFDRVDGAIGDNADALMMANYNVTQTLRLARKIPRVLATAEATLVAADGARVAAEAGVQQSRLTRTTLDMLAQMRGTARPETTAVIPVHEVAPRDVVSEEEETRSNVIPIRRVRRSPLAMVATIALTFATAAFSMSGMPYQGTPAMDCHRVEDAAREDVYDCGSGHLWVATNKVPSPNGGVDLDLAPYDK